MLRNDIKAFIKAIRKADNASVIQMLNCQPELVTAKAKSPPKKDDGQSPLQIAFKVGNFEAAELLLAKGADPDYQEKSSLNEWTAPVLHDAIRAVIFSSRTLCKDDSNFRRGLRIMRTMLEGGANPNAEDSYGNSCGIRTVLDARQVLLHRNVDLEPNGTVCQMRQVFALLSEFGADFDRPTSTREATRMAVINMGLAEYELLPSPSKRPPF